MLNYFAKAELRSREFVVANEDDSSRFDTDATLTFNVSPATSWTTPRAPAAEVDVLLNGKGVGELVPEIRKRYSFVVPAALLRHVNVLALRNTRVSVKPVPQKPRAHGSARARAHTHTHTCINTQAHERARTRTH